MIYFVLFLFLTQIVFAYIVIIKISNIIDVITEQKSLLNKQASQVNSYMNKISEVYKTINQLKKSLKNK